MGCCGWWGSLHFLASFLVGVFEIWIVVLAFTVGIGGVGWCDVALVELLGVLVFGWCVDG